MGQGDSTSMAYLTNIWFIIEVVIGFGLLIFVHELGHFLAAKLVGIRVERFSLGFPPKLFGFKWGETEYLISAVPLGGYVRMAGDDVYETTTPPAPGEFRSKSPGLRAIVILAGPMMNVAFAVPAAMLVFLLGIYQPSTLCEVDKPSRAYDAGLRTGDRILKVNGRTVRSFNDIHAEIMLSPQNSELTFTCEREGAEGVIQAAIRRPGESIDIGLRPFAGTTIASVEAGSPAEKAGIRRNDRVVAINGRPIKTWAELRSYMRHHPGEMVKLRLKRPVPSDTVYPVYKELEVSTTLLACEVYSLGFEEEYVLLPLAGSIVGEPASSAGLQRGDLILSIDGEAVSTWQEMREIIYHAPAKKGSRPLDIALWRDGKVVEVKVTPRLFHGEGLIGVGSGRRVVRVARAPGVRESRTGKSIREGDIIFKINGKTIWKEGTGVYHEVLENSGGKPVRVTILRRGEGLRVDFVELNMTPVRESVGFLGAVQGVETVLRRYGVLVSFTKACRETIDITHKTFQSIYRLLTRDISARNVSGPAGIVTVLFYKAREGLSDFVHLIFVISVNLALINLFPIPILDGGHIVMLIAEKIKGRPVKEKTLAILQYAGLAILLMLVILATRNDVQRWFF